MSLTQELIEKHGESTVLSILLIATHTITREEYMLVFRAFGDNKENWENVLYARLGLTSLEQFIEALLDDGQTESSIRDMVEIPER